MINAAGNATGAASSLAACFSSSLENTAHCKDHRRAAAVQPTTRAPPGIVDGYLPQDTSRGGSEAPNRPQFGLNRPRASPPDIAKFERAAAYAESNNAYNERRKEAAEERLLARQAELSEIKSWESRESPNR